MVVVIYASPSCSCIDTERVAGIGLVASLVKVLPMCIKEQVLAQRLGIFIRLSLRARTKWLSETASGSLHVDLAARVMSDAAQLYTSTSAVEQGVAMTI